MVVSKLMLACLAVATPATAVLLEHGPSKQQHDVEAPPRDESLKLGRSRTGSKPQHLSQAELDQTKTKAKKLKRNKQFQHFQELLNSTTHRHVNELMLTGKGTGKMRGALEVDQKALIDIAVDAGQEDSFVALAGGLKTKLLMFSTDYVTDVQMKCDDFKEAIAADTLNQHSKMHVKKLLEDLKMMLAEQQSNVAVIMKRMRQAMPQNLKTILAPIISHLSETPANPFDVDLRALNGVAKDENIVCEKIGLVFAGLAPFRENILKSHMWLNSTAPTLKVANNNSMAFLVPRLTGMVYLGMLGFEEAHRLFTGVAPIIKHRLRCGQSAAHVDEEQGLTNREHNRLQRRTQKQFFQWIQTETVARRTQAVVERGDETLIRDLKQAIADAQTQKGSQDLEKYMKSQKIAAQDYMATFFSEVKVAAQDFVAASLNTSTRAEWEHALDDMSKKVRAAEDTVFEASKTWRKRLDELLPKGLMPFAIKFLGRANKDHHMLHIDVARHSGCKDIVNAFENAAFQFGNQCVAKLNDLDKEAYAVDAASGSVTVMQNILETAYTETLGQREAIHALISASGPAIGAKKFGCSGIHDHLRGTKWWNDGKM